MTRLQTIATAWVAFVLVIVVIDVALPQHLGLFALGEIFEPYIVLTGLVAGIFAIRGSGRSRVLVLILIVTAVGRYGPVWISFPPPPGEQQLHVSAWNIEAGPASGRRALEGLSTSGADLAAFEEVGREAWAALQTDATGFEFKALAPDPTELDVALLSRFPILEAQFSTEPPFLRAVVDPLTAEPIVVYVIHSPLGRFVTIQGVPVTVDLNVRDAAMAMISLRVQADVAAGKSVIVMGDFNTTEREPAYAEISAGLHDAHLDAGTGPGLTWRPGPVSFLPAGILRIDYVLSTPDLVANSTTVDCSLPSDHCRVDANLTMTRTRSP